MTANTAQEQSAALSNVESSTAPPTNTNSADTAQLGAAVSNLSLSSGQQAPAAKAAAAVPSKPVKIDAADVTFLVEQLELHKTKATELLKRNGGDRMAALREFVIPTTA